jgi:hypothetical protein
LGNDMMLRKGTRPPPGVFAREKNCEPTIIRIEKLGMLEGDGFRNATFGIVNPVLFCAASRYVPR